MNKFMEFLAMGAVLAEILSPYVLFFIILHFVIKWW